MSTILIVTGLTILVGLACLRQKLPITTRQETVPFRLGRPCRKLPDGAVIESVDCRTGQTVRSYRDRKAAARDGYSCAQIYRVLRGERKSYAGLGWRLHLAQPEVPEVPEATKEPATNRKAVECFDLVTEETIKQYRSITAASKDGHHPSAISWCLSGVIRRHHGLGWRRVTSLPAQPPASDVEIALDKKRLNRKQLADLNKAVFYHASLDKWALRCKDGRLLFRDNKAELIELWHRDCEVYSRQQPVEGQRGHIGVLVEAVRVDTGQMIKFPSIAEAARATGISYQRLYNAVARRAVCEGYSWTRNQTAV